MKILDSKFMKGFIKMADDGFQQGWHERNGGDLSYRLKNEEVEMIRPRLNAPGEWQPIGTEVPGLAGEFFLVTGSGKYFRNIAVDPEAVSYTHLVPYGEICGQKEDSPTLTYNTIGRHISKMVYTKVVSNKSPWLQKAALGGVYCNPASHGEGRFVANDEWLAKLLANGQVATQYVNPNGDLDQSEESNINGSTYNIEGITSPDGRVLGKMAHSERRDNGVAINIYGQQDIQIFESGVEYFK